MNRVLRIACALCFVGTLAWAADPPQLVNYQGVLRDASGRPLTGTYDMTFLFYDTAAGSNLLLTDTHAGGAGVNVSNGLFNVKLGGGTLTAGAESSLLGVFANHSGVFMALQVGTETLSPRLRVLSSAFSQSAHTIDGKESTTFLDTTSTTQTKGGALFIDTTGSGYGTAFGSTAKGSSAAGAFVSDNGSTSVLVGAGTYGITSQSMGDYGAQIQNLGHGSQALIATPDYGIDANGILGGAHLSCSHGEAFLGADYIEGYVHTFVGVKGVGKGLYSNGGWFTNDSGDGEAYLGTGSVGIVAKGSSEGGDFIKTSNNNWAYIAYSTNKISGSGSVAFVQNHPQRQDRVIVYNCPEGDEVATYTRGSGRLTKGEARIALGETFQWVTNPDLGLTAHLTPRGDCKGLYVASLSTTEMVVKEIGGGASDTAFDYLVYGLRIGFEETSIVQDKQRESYIPSFKDHRARYTKYPELRAFNALERFKVIETSVRPEKALDLSHADALKATIHEYDPATDPPVEKLFGYSLFPQEARTAGAARTSPVSSSATKAKRQSSESASAPSAPEASDGQGTTVPSVFLEERPCLPSSETVEEGDLLVMDPIQEGFMAKGRQQGDSMVVGLAARAERSCQGEASQRSEHAGVPLVTTGIAPCRVDATYGPIRRGDLLVASPTPGHAMRAENIAPGTVVGKALEPLASGTGLIKVLVMLR
jgi:hypothetical protein